MMQNEIQPVVEPFLTGQPFPLGGQDQWVELSWEGWATKLIWHTKIAMSKSLA